MFATDLFKGQVALITGGLGGIGSHVARELARYGATVVAADRPREGDSSDQLSQFLAVDVTRVEELQALATTVASQHGRLDILINAAGVVSHGAAASITEAEWDRVIDINLKGTFFACQAVMPIMKQQQYGRIINLGSVLGKNGGNPRPWIDPKEQQKAGNAAYGATKAAVHALTFYLAKELASSGITVNALSPGPISSAMTTSFPETLRALIPVGRMGTVDDVAMAALFLAAPMSGYITGEVLDVNGGLWTD